MLSIVFWLRRQEAIVTVIFPGAARLSKVEEVGRETGKGAASVDSGPDREGRPEHVARGLRQQVRGWWNARARLRPGRDSVHAVPGADSLATDDRGAWRQRDIAGHRIWAL